MATHERPDDKRRPLITYICNPEHHASANQCIEFLKNLPLKVWETQYPKPKDYTCWYVSFDYKEKPWILNFTIRSAFTIVEYRYPQYIPDYLLDRMQWQTNNWKYEKLTSETEGDIEETMHIYLNGLKDDFESGKLKQGGKSFAEGFVAHIIEDTFTGQPIKRNIRPEWLRSVRGKCLELDIFLPEMKLAIEIQGLQHFVDLYSNKEQHDLLRENDLFKKRICRENSIKLIWMDWEGVNKCLMKVPREKRIETIKNLLDGFAKSGHNFLMWKNMIDMTFE